MARKANIVTLTVSSTPAVLLLFHIMIQERSDEEKEKEAEQLQSKKVCFSDQCDL